MKLLRGFLVTLTLMVGAQKDLALQSSTTEAAAVVSFQDVWNRSFCRPLEKMVAVTSEYPEEVEHIFKPACVSVRRCCGCCADEQQQCVPVEKASVTMELMKIKPKAKSSIVKLSFVEHRKCECRPQQDALN